LFGDKGFDKVKNINNKVNLFEEILSHVSGGKSQSFFICHIGSLCTLDIFLMWCILGKNVFDNVIGTLLNVPIKSKDGIRARFYLRDMGIRKKLEV